MSLSGRELQDALIACARCGACREGCPVFAELLDESYTARGKMALVEALVEGRLRPSDDLVERLSKCLFCLRCRETCSNDVPTVDIIAAGRALAARERGLPLYMQGLLDLMGREKWPDSILEALAALQPLALDGANPLLPEALRGKHLPPITPPRLRDRVPVESLAEPELGRVVFFPGCMTDYIYPGLGLDIIRVLNKYGVTVLLPSELRCCGTPAFLYGAEEMGERWVEANTAAMNAHEADAIITGCASCGFTLKEHYAGLDAPVMDVMEYLAAHPEYFPPSPPDRGVITYHDPCHAVRGQGVADEPRRVLRMAGYTLREMSEPDRCCGGGGLFHMRHPDLGRAVRERKVADILGTGAPVVATGCPGCIMHIADGLAGSGVSVIHPVQLLLEPSERASARGESGAEPEEMAGGERLDG